MRLKVSLQILGFILAILFISIISTDIYGFSIIPDSSIATNVTVTDSSNFSKDTSGIKYLPQYKPELTIKRVKNNSITIDGKLDDEGWKNATVAGNFVEISPRDNAIPDVKTEVMLAYDDDNLYVAYINFETDVTSIRSHISDRDKIFNDDFCGLMIDTYGDSKQAIEIYTNPYGIQGDLLMEVSGNEDSNYDLIYESEAKIYKDKWIAELKIPFKSLRFPDKNIQQWRIDLFRNRPRVTRQQISWVALDRDLPAFMTQFGYLNGIQNIKNGKNFEVLPYALASQAGYLNDNSNPNSGFTNEKLKLKGGIGIKYSFTSNLTGEATVNPDFSQVESDATQISVNSSFALFYPEKRPFFLEGANIFNSPYTFVYTRSLNDPLYAAKLVGKVAGLDVGFISGYDIHTPFIVPFEEHWAVLSSDKRSFSNILRLKKSLKEESFFGLLATDRRIGNAHNTLFSFDGLLKFKENYYFRWQVAGSSTKELNDTSLYSSNTIFGKNHTESLDGEYYNGFLGYLDLQRNARTWSFDISYDDASPGFRADNGFISNNDYRTIAYWSGLTFYTDSSKIFTSISPQVSGDIRYDYSGKFKEVYLNPHINLNLTRQINIFAMYLLVNDEDYGGILHKGVHRGQISFSIKPTGYLQFSTYLEIGKYIARNETPSFVGYGINGELYLLINPTDRLSLENTYDYSELSRSYRGEKIYAGYIFRNKTIYQFTKNLCLRLISQYDSFSSAFEIDPLISYKLNPFTIFYIGSTHELTNFTNSYNRSIFVQSNRQFFAKIQYLWRL